MGFGGLIQPSDLAFYRLIKGGDSGLNLKLEDLYGRSYELPSIWGIIRSLFTGKKLYIKAKGYPASLIRRLELIQIKVDKLMEREIEKAKRKAR